MIRALVVSMLVLVAGAFFVFGDKHFDITSPVPKVFGESKTIVINKWFPHEKFTSSKFFPLSLSAKSAIAVDFDTGEILYSKNLGERLPVASTVKIMTALVALSSADSSTIYSVSDRAAKVGENSMGLVAGEKLTLHDLLYGLILVSGNDAAVTIAEGVAGSEDKFVAEMNQASSALGITNTKFVNSSGLDADGSNDYSTAYDMAVIAHYVWDKYPLFRQVSGTYHKYIEATGDHATFDLYSDTNLLTTYPGVGGIKPGFTWEAGLCLVTYAQNDGKRILAVVLGSDDRRGDMKELLDYSFNSYGIHISHPALDL